MSIGPLGPTGPGDWDDLFARFFAGGGPRRSAQRIDITKYMSADARQVLSDAARRAAEVAPAGIGVADLDTDHLLWGALQQDQLKQTVRDIVKAICGTLDDLKAEFPTLTTELSPDVTFVTTQELEDTYPDLTPKQREDEICRKYRTVFIMQIGGRLRSGIKHDGRAPDYDDWTLNGDIMFWNDVLGRAFEVSSMGIRVDPDSLDRQLTEAGCDDRRKMEFHRMLLEGRLPLTIGGGIGQSRLSMLLLSKCHIGEVQVSHWDDKTLRTCAANGIDIL